MPPKNPFGFVANSTNREKYINQETPDKENPFDFVKNSKSVLTETPTGGSEIPHEITKYDEGYLSLYDDLNKYKARQQPWTDQLGNSIAKAIPGTALKILENAGDLGELVLDWDKDKEYSNIFTELAQKGNKALNEQFHTYQETPANQFASPMDSGWWFNMGDGLVQSIGAFWATGAGVGGTLSKGAKAINGALQGGELGLKLGQGAAQLGTASSLAYTEGIQSAAQVYTATKEKAAQDHPEWSQEQIKAFASEASSKTMMLNTVLNTGLNITSLSPLFKSYGHLDDEIRKQLSRKASESGIAGLGKYITRLEALENQGVKQASIMKTLASEALQEGVEEDVNIFAENEGYRTGKVDNMIRSNKAGAIDRFFDTMFSEEGAINFLSGAVGGVVQTGGMEYAPIRSKSNEDGTTSRVSARTLETDERQKAQKETIVTFKNDLKALQAAQQTLNSAIQKGDKVAIEQARHDLFNIAALKSIRNETSEELANEIARIASIDNTKVGQDQLTDAQRQGFADNIDDNKYKQTATKKAADIRALNKEYRDLQADTFSNNKLALNEAFRHRLNLHSTEAVLEDLTIHTAEQENKVAKLLPDIALFGALKTKAELEANKIAQIKGKESGVDVTNKQAALEEALKSVYQADPALEQKVVANQALINNLVSAYVAKDVLTARVTKAKETYADILSNPKEFEKSLKKEVDKITKAQEDKKKAEVKEATKVKQQEDLTKAKEEKKKEVEEKPIVTPESPESRLISQIRKAETEKDLDAFLNYADKQGITSTEVIDEIGKRRSSIQTGTTSPAAIEQLENIPVNSLAYQGKTDKDAQEEFDTLYDIVNETNEENNPTYGQHNKIAYKAQEQTPNSMSVDKRTYDTVDPSALNDRYKILHSGSFSEGADIELQVVYFDGNKLPQINSLEDNKNIKDEDIHDVAIGVFYEGQVVGYLPKYTNQNKELLAVRTFVVRSDKPVKTKIAKKTLGNLNKSVKQPVVDAIKILPKFAVGNNGSFNTNLETPYEGQLVNKETARTGYVYAIIETPLAGKEIAIPVDINTITEEIADSVIAALNLYINSDELEQDALTVVEDVFHKYGINITTRKGLQEYLNMFIHTTNLDANTEKGADNLRSINEEKKDNYYIQVSANGIRYASSGRIKTIKGVLTASEIGRNTTDASKFYKHLKEHIQKTYFKVDLTRLQDKSKFEAPLFRIQDGKVSVGTYSKDSYAEYIASNTTTNIESIKLDDKEQTVLVQPTLYVDYSFLGNSSAVTKKEENTEKTVILASNKPNLAGVASMPFKKKGNPTITDAQQLKDNCK